MLEELYGELLNCIKETQKKLAEKFVKSNVGLMQAQIFAQHAGLKLKNKLSF